MATQTAKLIWLIVSALAVILVSVLATLGIQKLNNKSDIPTPVPPQPLMAQVIAVNPNYVNVSKPVKNCKPSRQVTYVAPPQQGKGMEGAAGAVIGGVAGGLLGSTVKGNNRSLAIGVGAAAGALTGKAVGENMQQTQAQPQPQVQEKMHCSTHYVNTPVQKGYQVTYVLNGQQGMIIMDQPPQSPTLSLPLQGTGQQSVSSAQATHQPVQAQ